ncbi:hypothetical protein [Streptomyces sp. NPDC127100]|uniref:hypothetical protein n=1 Tax=Streptomyces sp. NPDC127100 TaxID=3347138 RepID=UPI0036590263
MAIDWGTLPTWISGLGSTGALWVGALTLRRAQDKERRSEADAVTCRWDRSDCCGYDNRSAPNWIASVANDATRPVRNVYLVTYDAQARALDDSLLLANVLQPKVADHEHITGPPPERSRPAAVIFRDADGTWWLRDILEQSLYRQSAIPWTGRVRRTLRRLRKEQRLPLPRQLPRGAGRRAPW